MHELIQNQRAWLASHLVWVGCLCCFPSLLQGDYLSLRNKVSGIEFIQSHCLDCHSGPNADGELDLSTLIEQRPFVRQQETWRNISLRVALGDMPPRDAEILTQEAKDQFADWYQNEIESFDYATVRHPGYEPVRRLTHVEYQNTIRDLFKIDSIDISKFSPDLSGQSGFANSSNTLFLQTGLLEKYAQSAELIVGQIFSSEAEPPFPEARKRLLSAGNDQENARDRAEAILTKFSNRAFRRPVTEKELSDLIAVFDSSFSAGKTFNEAIQKSLTAVLIMPQFLFKIESAVVANEPRQIDDFELASRLSYFLWASMPDNQLLRLASRGELSKPEVLNQQIERMLRNSRARSLGSVFAAEWLGFDDVGIRRRQDPIDNPWCTETLMEAMRSESALFFYSLIRDDQPIQRLVDARYTYLNEELARHYGIRGIKGSKMRPVRLKTQKRGGILTHASILSVTAFPDRTSPVIRGHWVLDRLLGTPPPDPPPDVSEISDVVLERDDLSFRQKVQLHSQNPRCSACHQEMDPIGFSLENYDNFGRYRTRRFGEAIDADGALPNGHAFSGASGLREVIISERKQDLTRQVARKMLTYALGRQLEYFDEAAVREIIESTRNDGNRFQPLVKAIVRSYPFMFKQSNQGELQK